MERRHLKEDDPRSALEKARRGELVVFARQNNIDDIDPGMPATLMRKILRQRGVTNIQPGHPNLGTIGRTVIDPLGRTRRQAVPASAKSKAKTKPGREAQREASREPVEPEVTEVDAETLCEMQYRAQSKPKPPIEKMTMAALRAEAKRRHVRIARTDKKAEILAKLRPLGPAEALA